MITVIGVFLIVSECACVVCVQSSPQYGGNKSCYDFGEPRELNLGVFKQRPLLFDVISNEKKPDKREEKGRVPNINFHPLSLNRLSHFLLVIQRSEGFKVIYFLTYDFLPCDARSTCFCQSESLELNGVSCTKRNTNIYKVWCSPSKCRLD